MAKETNLETTGTNDHQEENQNIKTNDEHAKEYPVTEYPRYFAGQYLYAEDFDLQQRYLADRTRYLTQKLHVSGIIEGLDVKISEDKKTVEITEGSAINSSGQLIVLKESITKNIEEEIFSDSDKEDTKINLYIMYDLTKEAPQESIKDSSSTRYREKPNCYFAQDPSDEKTQEKLQKSVLLAQLTKSGEVEKTERKYSGIALPEGNQIRLHDEKGLEIRSNEELRYLGKGHKWYNKPGTECRMSLDSQGLTVTGTGTSTFGGELKVDGDGTSEFKGNINCQEIRCERLRKKEEYEYEQIELTDPWTKDEKREPRYYIDIDGWVNMEGIIRTSKYKISEVGVNFVYLINETPIKYRPVLATYEPFKEYSRPSATIINANLDLYNTTVPVCIRLDEEGNMILYSVEIMMNWEYWEEEEDIKKMYDEEMILYLDGIRYRTNDR